MVLYPNTVRRPSLKMIQLAEKRAKRLNVRVREGVESQLGWIFVFTNDPQTDMDEAFLSPMLINEAGDRVILSTALSINTYVERLNRAALSSSDKSIALRQWLKGPGQRFAELMEGPFYEGR